MWAVRCRVSRARSSATVSRAPRALAAVLALASLGACGTVRVSSHPSLRLDEAQAPLQYDDGAVAAAFGARPQLPARVRVAVYSLDPDATRAAALRARLAALPRVVSVYEISPLLAAGRRRYDRDDVAPAAAPSLRTLRVLAARARCELLLVVDHATRSEQTPNAFAALNVLLVPALFAPYLDVRDESYLDVYAVDTRNGYLYTQLGATRRSARTQQTIWSVDDRASLDAQWASMLGETQQALAQWLRDEPALAEEGAEENQPRATASSSGEPRRPRDEGRRNARSVDALNDGAAGAYGDAARGR